MLSIIESILYCYLKFKTRLFPTYMNLLCVDDHGTPFMYVIHLCRAVAKMHIKGPVTSQRVTPTNSNELIIVNYVLIVDVRWANLLECQVITPV